MFKQLSLYAQQLNRKSEILTAGFIVVSVRVCVLQSVFGCDMPHTQVNTNTYTHTHTHCMCQRHKWTDTHACTHTHTHTHTHKPRHYRLPNVRLDIGQFADRHVPQPPIRPDEAPHPSMWLPR